MIEEEIAALKLLIAKMPYQDLLARKDHIESRLDEISIDDPFASARQKKKKGISDSVIVIAKSRESELIPYEPKTDVHWDFVMKEMQWLSADFQSERKRQMSLAKKLAMSIGQFHATKEKRRLRLHAEMELKRRRLASRMARDVVKGWWNAKIERVIAYKQKVDADLHRKRGMDKHLLFLVRQTERYTGLLNEELMNDNNDRKPSNRRAVTIEDALQQDSEWKRSARISHRTNYKVLAIKLEGSESEFYGETTEDEEESEMEDYTPDLHESEDDETTLLEAERNFSEADAKQEAQLLMEESTMDIAELLKRLETEREVALNDNENGKHIDDGNNEIEIHKKGFIDRRVRFQEALYEIEPESESNAVKKGKNVDGHMADDDADMSDVDDFRSESDGSEEYEGSSENEIDDMTTFEAELKMKPEIDPKEEVALLEKEAEMSLDELRAMYVDMAPDDSTIENSVNQDYGDDESINSVQTTGSDEYEDDVHELDDETTIEAEERLGRDMSYEEEISLLQKENEMSIEELRQKYASLIEDNVQSDIQPSDDEDNNKKLSDSSKSRLESMFGAREHHDEDEDEDLEEFVPEHGADLDDETTLEAEEKLGREMTYEDEIALLNKESAMSLEELQKLYCRSPDLDEESAVRDESHTELEDNEISNKRKLKQSDHNEMVQKKLKISQEDDEGAIAMRNLEVADAKARNTAVSRPYLLAPWVKLREYQQIGLNWLVSIQTRRLNGILADEMGLGKTLQTIALLSYLAAYKGIWGPHLIIVPTSCIVNWEVEIKRFCPAFKVLCYYGSAKKRKELRQGWTKLNWHHVIITSYQLVVQDSFAFKRKRWYYMVLDEAHNIKNFQSQRWQTLINFNTQRRLLLTGTPLQNNLMELWSLLHFLMPHIFRSRKEFSYWFSNPMNNMIEGNSSRNDDLISRLHGIIRPFILRRLKKDVETQMPGKFEHIVKCHLSRRQMFLYEEFMSRSSTRLAMQKGGNYMGMMNVLMQLRKVCNHPDLFEPRSIVTPFSPEPISMVTASCVVNPLKFSNCLTFVSSFYLHPIWTTSCGVPSFETALKQDQFHCGQRRRLQIDRETLKNKLTSDNNIDEPSSKGVQNPGLRRYLEDLWLDSKLEREAVAERQFKANAGRCENNPFPYASDILDSVATNSFWNEFVANDDRITSTPNELLKLMRIQKQCEEDELDILRKSFVFYVPKASVQSPMLFPETRTIESQPFPEEVYPTTVNSNHLFFPDKKLIQFDAGKLQILAELLRNLKLQKHRVLIFTQMSKMLDILEAFLNLNGHTYLRLDGSTGVDQRQRMMDRFNNDEKIFCFILSTRSGGLGINLTGADTVVFYDSDWNPAMDAQAQDRAHRIGQTRDVHIYRLVTEHSIEENILIKAKQKRHLDFLVMDEGKFHAAPEHIETNEDTEAQNSKAFDMSSKAGLRSILGVEDAADVEEGYDISAAQMESAMAELEDEDDVKALRGAEQEAKQELEEFDEDIQYKKDDDEAEYSQDENEAEMSNKVVPLDEKQSEVDNQAALLEKEFQEWQMKLGADKASIDACLNPVERYALRFKEDIDPFYSIWFLSEQQRLNELDNNREDEWDIDLIEELKAEEERYAIEDGDLLATNPGPSDLPRQRHLYFREKGRLSANKRRRKLTGEDWCTKVDGKTNLPFWYNIDSGEATWDEPNIITELKEYDLATKQFWNALPINSLLHVMEYLVPYPERFRAGQTCKHWHTAAHNPFFVKHVYPVEMGALNMDPEKMEKYHYRTIVEALTSALPGDTIELGDGHYWINDDVVNINFPLRFIGDEKDASHVVIEIRGSLIWRASKGYIEGVTLRRPRIGDINTSSEVLRVERDANLIFVYSAIDCGGSTVATHAKNSTCAVSILGGFCILKSIVRNSNGSGIICFPNSRIELTGCDIRSNVEYGIIVHEGSNFSSDLKKEDVSIIRNVLKSSEQVQQNDVIDSIRTKF